MVANRSEKRSRQRKRLFVFIVAVVMLQLAITRTVRAARYSPKYEGGKYVGCTVTRLELIPGTLYLRAVENTLPAGALSESACTFLRSEFGIVYQPQTTWDVSAYQFGGYDMLATRSLETFTQPSDDVPIAFGPTEVDSDVQAGLGVNARLNSLFAIAIGLTTGTATASRSASSRTHEEASFRLFGASITGKIYPFQTAVSSIEPWLSAGARGLALRPEGGTYTRFGETVSLESDAFEPVAGVDFLAGAGVDVRLTDTFKVTLSGEHGFETGWRAGLGVNMSFSPRPANTPTETPAPDRPPISSPSFTVPVTLRNYWVETISREEAIARLNSRPLTPDIRERLASEIPPLTTHYLVFSNEAFREFVVFGDAPANLVLLLPTIRTEAGYDVIVPLYGPQVVENGHTRDIRGIEIHHFESREGVLYENGKPRPTFTPSKLPITLNVDTSFLEPGPEEPQRHVKGGRCCRACEWVHSKLDIHCADRICCLGLCDPAATVAAVAVH